MTFDSNISAEISLSKILDAFFIENETPEIIVSFLKQYDNEFKDIIKYSLFYNRIFQLDFFLSCKQNDQEYIISKLIHIDSYDAAILIWQILGANSEKVLNLKNRVKKELKHVLAYKVTHPYAYGHKKYIEELDEVCFKFAETDSIVNIPNLVNKTKLPNYFKYLEYSLFQNRLLQYDFFVNLDDASKYIFINKIFEVCTIKNVIRFSMQILDLDKNIEVKKYIYDKLYDTIISNDLIDEKIFNIIQECSSFSEFMLKMTIFNNDVSQYIALYLLLFKIKWIKDWIEYDVDSLNTNLNISDLYYYLRKK